MNHIKTIPVIHVCLLLLWWLTVAVGAEQAAAANPVANTEKDVVTYEAFGAVGDGVTDDLPAIRDAHAYANQQGLRVRSNPNATYHLGRRALTAIIATDTDWGTSRFIIDDSQGVENHRQPLFEVRSLLKPVPLKIDRLEQGQTRLNLRPDSDCLVFVENKSRKLFIRKGLNQSYGTEQKEVFILRRDGSIEGGIDWNYDVVTRVQARPIDPEPLVLRGGIFTNIANRMRQEVGYNYWGRNIQISRSNTEVDGVTIHVIGETDVGHPYSGFLIVQQCANITLRNCLINGRKTYRTIGSAGEPVAMGTYGYQANLVVNFRMINCRMENIHDRTRWGIIGCNFMKNVLVEDCVLSRMDVHQGVSGSYIIRGSTLGYAGLNAIGRGRLIVENSTLYGGNLIMFRSDYGSTWEGEILVRNSRWIPPAGAANPEMFGMSNDGTHDFGYPCFMPRVIRIEGLFVDDSKHPRDYQGITFFSDPIGTSGGERPFPYRLTERLEVRDLKTSSGRPPRVCPNPEVARAITVVLASGSTSAEQPERMNILLLYADDLGYGDLGCYNEFSKIPTPHLNRLAREGLRFTDAHSSSGVCTPSRYALLTGRHHWRDFHGIVNAFGKSVFKPGRLTLPEMLQAKGYTTAAMGKWHLGWDWDAIRKPGAEKKGIAPEDFDWSKSIPGGPLAHGFDHYFGDTVINFPPYCWIEDDRVVKAPDTMMDTRKWKPIKEGNWECRPGPMITGWDPYQNIPETTRRGVRYIHAQKDSEKPFFLYFAYPSPHAPIIPNDAFDGKSGAGPYGDFVYETDHSIGQLLRALEESGQADKTIVIFSADNGPEKYAYARHEKFDHWSPHPLRGLKRDIYEGGHRVPTIIRWPGITRPGVCDALVSQIDFMATLASALGCSLPDNAAEDSHDLLPLLKGEVASVRTTHVHNTNKDHYAIRHGDWVLVDAGSGYVSGANEEWEKRHGYKPDNKSPVELFNLKTDLEQKHNVAADHPERVAELQALLQKIREQGHSAPRLAK